MTALWCLCLAALAEVPAVQVKGNLIQSEPGTIRVELLLEHGADKNVLDRAGQKPLHWAARHRQDELLDLLS